MNHINLGAAKQREKGSKGKGLLVSWLIPYLGSENFGPHMSPLSGLREMLLIFSLVTLADLTTTI